MKGFKLNIIKQKFNFLDMSNFSEVFKILVIANFFVKYNIIFGNYDALCTNYETCTFLTT